jgi:hypothetical protein
MTRTAFFTALVVLTLSALAGPVAAQRRAGWTLLGTRNVSDRADHDTVAVTRARGTYDALRFEVRGKSVDFHRVVVHYANGGEQTLEMRETVRAGGTTRAIDLNGSDRVITHIDFWYDANTIGRGGSATVRVLGRR